MEYLDTKHRKIDDTSKLSIKSKLGTPATKPGVPVKPGKKVSKKSVKSKGLIFGRVTTTDQMVFLDNLSTMIKAGLALAPALLTLTKEIKNKYFRKILEHLYEMIENGQSLSDGMKKYPKSFSDMIISAVEVGENTGALAESLAHLAGILSSQKKMRSKVISALIYPTVVIIAMIGISVFLAFFVFPQLIGTFEEAGVKLPPILLAVQFITWAIQAYGWYILAGVTAIIFLFSMIFRIPAVKLWSATVILRVPFVGNLIRELSISRFANNLQALLASGLSIVRSLEIVSKTVPNLKYRQVILLMAKELEKGKSLAASMADRPHLFTSLSIQLSHVGEDTGELDGILKKIGEYYEDRVSNVLTNLSSIIEPVLLVTVGVAVGFIALSVIAPMYELTQSFAQ